MHIRKVKPSDIERLYSIFINTQVRKIDIEKNQVPKSGFYEYDLTFEQFSKRTSTPDLSLILVNDENKILSYALAFPLNSDFKNLKDPVVDNLLENMNVSDDQGAIYLDQLLMIPNLPLYYAGRLFDTWKYLMRNENISNIYAAIPEQPWKNISSTKFIHYHGFKRIGSVAEEKTTLGIFQTPLMKIVD